MNPHPNLTPEVIRGIGWLYVLLFATVSTGLMLSGPGNANDGSPRSPSSAAPT